MNLVFIFKVLFVCAFMLNQTVQVKTCLNEPEFVHDRELLKCPTVGNCTHYLSLINGKQANFLCVVTLLFSVLNSFIKATWLTAVQLVVVVVPVWLKYIYVSLRLEVRVPWEYSDSVCIVLIPIFFLLL